MCALANSCATAAAVSGNAFGSIRLACSGQTTRTMGGMALGSSNSMLMVSWLIWADGQRGDGMIHWGLASSLSGFLSPVGSSQFLAGHFWVG